MRTLVTGATGLIGRELLRRIPEAVVLSRSPAHAGSSPRNVEVHAWSPETGPPPAAALAGVEAVINLAGEPVAGGRWTAERKRRIRDSRVLGTRNLVAGLRAHSERPRVLVSASAVGYYGDRGDETLDESSARGSGFLADVCAEWEHEAMAAEAVGVRVVCVRIGVVLAPGGGALDRMLPVFRLGAGGRLGSGRQWMSWVHLEDVAGMLLHGATHDEIRGPLAAVGPTPVTNADFTRALGRALHRPTLLPVPTLALRVAFGEMSDVLVASQRVVPRIARATGYVHRFTELGSALADVLK